jgi:hypothetical protein
MIAPKKTAHFRRPMRSLRRKMRNHASEAFGDPGQAITIDFVGRVLAGVVVRITEQRTIRAVRGPIVAAGISTRPRSRPASVRSSPSAAIPPKTISPAS